jgi:5'-deoxynucleotidase YfbR-like HD superfamily hydrolase
MTWMQTASGKEFNLVAPTAAMVDFGDVAEHLSKLARFAGATPGHFYSVAEHCVRAADALYAWGRDHEACAYALLHDAHEAYIVDRITPERWAEEAIARERFEDDRIVAAVCEVPKLLRYRIDVAVHEAAGLQFPLSVETQRLIKHIDLTMLATERRDLMRASPTPWPILAGVEPLTDRIAPWTWPFACRQYIEALARFLPSTAAVYGGRP